MRNIIPFEDSLFKTFCGTYGRIYYSRYSDTAVVYEKDNKYFRFPSDITRDEILELCKTSISERKDNVLEYVKKYGTVPHIKMSKTSLY